MTTLAFLLLKLSPFVLFLKLISCQLCNWNTLRNILVVLGRNIKQDERTCLLCYLNTLHNILMILGRTERDNVLPTRMITLAGLWGHLFFFLKKPFLVSFIFCMMVHVVIGLKFYSKKFLSLGMTLRLRSRSQT